MVIETIFWASAFLLIYTYLGYVIILLVLPGKRLHTESANSDLPKVTLIVAAYNEEAFIREKVENSLGQDYPADKFRLIVVSDGSDDATNDIVRKFDNPQLKFIEILERGGKANALNHAIRELDCDIAVFTDANVFLDRQAIRNIVRDFEDPAVGAVTGRVELEAIGSAEPLGEGAYMRFERMIQARESKFWSVAGVDGALFAARKSLIDEIPKDTILDDFVLGTGVALQGFRIRYDKEASAVEKVPAEVAQEFRRKTRIAAGNFQMLSRLKFADFFQSPLRFQFAFFSHKILRWYAPFLMLVAFVTNVFLVGTMLFNVVLIGQVGFYALALAARLFPPLRGSVITYVPYYFSAMNLALLVGWLRNVRSAQSVTWQRVDR